METSEWRNLARALSGWIFSSKTTNKVISIASPNLLLESDLKYALTTTGLWRPRRKVDDWKWSGTGKIATIIGIVC